MPDLERLRGAGRGEGGLQSWETAWHVEEQPGAGVAQSQQEGSEWQEPSWADKLQPDWQSPFVTC